MSPRSVGGELHGVGGADGDPVRLQPVVDDVVVPVEGTVAVEVLEVREQVWPVRDRLAILRVERLDRAVCEYAQVLAAYVRDARGGAGGEVAGLGGAARRVEIPRAGNARPRR